MSDVLQIREWPPHLSVVALLEAEGLPASDLTESHLEHFFFTGSDGAPSALVGLEIYGEAALLRSLVVSAAARTKGLASALLLHAEGYAAAHEVRSLYLLTTTAEAYSSIRFYRTLFGAEPTVTHSDYAKWMLEDPSVNFAISMNRRPVGVNHLGFQVESDEELRGMRAQLEAADARMVEENERPCCYAKSDKYWVTDPTGIAWETFHSLRRIPVYGEDTAMFNHGESSTLVEAPAVGWRVPAQRAQPASCCAK